MVDRVFSFSIRKFVLCKTNQFLDYVEVQFIPTEQQSPGLAPLDQPQPPQLISTNSAKIAPNDENEDEQDYGSDESEIVQHNSFHAQLSPTFGRASNGKNASGMQTSSERNPLASPSLQSTDSSKLTSQFLGQSKCFCGHPNCLTGVYVFINNSKSH